jgi:hypothetical protein
MTQPCERQRQVCLPRKLRVAQWRPYARVLITMSFVCLSKPRVAQAMGVEMLVHSPTDGLRSVLKRRIHHRLAHIPG